MTKQCIPALFRQKVILDRAMGALRSSQVISLHEFQLLKMKQTECKMKCESLYFPSKFKKDD